MLFFMLIYQIKLKLFCKKKFRCHRHFLKKLKVFFDNVFSMSRIDIVKGLENPKGEEKMTLNKNTQKTKKLNSGTYYIKGAKWFDKVNGNTYNACKIYNDNGEEIARLGFAYGYGDYYRQRAQEWLKANTRKNARVKLVDGGAYYTLQRDLKNFNF